VSTCYEVCRLGFLGILSYLKRHLLCWALLIVSTWTRIDDTCYIWVRISTCWLPLLNSTSSILAHGCCLFDLGLRRLLLDLPRFDARDGKASIYMMSPRRRWLNLPRVGAIWVRASWCCRSTQKPDADARARLRDSSSVAIRYRHRDVLTYDYFRILPSLWFYLIECTRETLVLN